MFAKNIAVKAALALAVALSLAAVGAAAAHETVAGALTIKHPWTRATPPTAKVAGGFMVIENAGSAADRLTGGRVDFAARVEVHEMAMDGDVMRMRELENGLEVPAGGAVELKPGGYHVMFMGLTAPLVEGERYRGVLIFETAGEVEVEFVVDKVAATMKHGMAH